MADSRREYAGHPGEMRARLKRLSERPSREWVCALTEVLEVQTMRGHSDHAVLLREQCRDPWETSVMLVAQARNTVAMAKDAVRRSQAMVADRRGRQASRQADARARATMRRTRRTELVP
jgi:hypothetical protein